MENPNEQQQAVLLKRIIGSVEKLNDITGKINSNLETLDDYSANVSNVTEVWSRYARKMQFFVDNSQN